MRIIANSTVVPVLEEGLLAMPNTILLLSFGMMSLLISVFDLTLEFSSPVPGDVGEAKSMNHWPYAAALVLIANEFTVGISIFQPRCLGHLELGLIFCVEHRDQFPIG